MKKAPGWAPEYTCAEELSRRESKDSLAPIDRDPVPNRFAESVRRYYEELGKDQPEVVR